ncbi:MAG: hypothetical protein ABWY37_11760 [Microbacterium pygmaeum]
MPTPRVRTILVGGHESADGAHLVRLEALLEDTRTARPGRQFHNQVSEALSAGETVVVVPMTFGRNPTMIADTAKTLRWLGSRHPHHLALAAPFGTTDHLTAWVRTAANTVRAEQADAALVVVAPRSNPFDEAELHRIAYLAATHGAADEVFPAILDSDRALAPVIDRLQRLGLTRSAIVPAGFASTATEAFGAGEYAGARFAGPLMSDAAIARTVRTRVADALTALAAGHDGIAAGLDADHGHGYAHSHAFEESGHARPHSQAGHAHPHSHGGHAHAHAHSHSHSHGGEGDSTHTHADGTTHDHDHDGLHAHVHAS